MNIEALTLGFDDALRRRSRRITHEDVQRVDDRCERVRNPWASIATKLCLRVSARRSASLACSIAVMSVATMIAP